MGEIMKTRKEILKEAHYIHASFHNYMGYICCDGEEDLLCFRRWILKREKEAIKKALEEAKQK